MDSKKRIIFLDFDGCCNSYKEGSYITNGPETYGPSDTICGMLADFCERNGVNIIISSNWRKFEPDGHYTFGGVTVTNPLGMLKERLSKYIIGELPKERHITKAFALILWMEDNDVKDGDIEYVIFDDDPLEEFQTTTDMGIYKHFILTDPKFGVTETDLEKAEKILKIPPCGKNDIMV